MSDKPITLRLADALEGDAVSPLAQVAAAELRRLHAENTALKEQVAPQRQPLRTITYVCPICAASLERQE